MQRIHAPYSSSLCRFCRCYCTCYKHQEEMLQWLRCMCVAPTSRTHEMRSLGHAGTPTTQVAKNSHVSNSLSTTSHTSTGSASSASPLTDGYTWQFNSERLLRDPAAIQQVCFKRYLRPKCRVCNRSFSSNRLL